MLSNRHTDPTTVPSLRMRAEGNEHINRIIKFIIQNMGSNLTETSPQRSVSTLNIIYQTFDVESGVPYGTFAHSTRSDTQDVAKVVGK